jgi:hypothetical protein
MTSPLKRFTVSDGCLLVGLALIARGAFLVSSAVGWALLGVAVMILGVITAVPPANRPPSPPKESR